MDICGDYIFVSLNGKKQVLKETEGALEVVLDNLSKNASLTTKGDYYYLQVEDEKDIFDKDLRKVEFNLPNLPEGYELVDLQQYAEQDYMTVRKEISRETTSSGYINIKYEYNISDKLGNLILEEAVQSKHNGLPFSVYKDYIWDMENGSLYSITDKKVIWSLDEKKPEIEEKIKDKLEEGWTIGNAYYNNDYKTINVEIYEKVDNGYNRRYVSYNDYNGNGFVVLFDGLQFDDYLFVIDRKVLRNLVTGEETKIPYKVDDFFNLRKVFGNIVIRCYAYPEDDPDNNEWYMLMDDGSIKKFDGYWFSEKEDVNYNLCTIKEGDICHWYMNSLDNEILKTDSGDVNWVIQYGTGYFYNTDSTGFVSLYDQYGNIILGEETKYTGISNSYVERNEMGLYGLIYGYDFIQDGYTLICDENGKFGLVSLSIKYTLQGEVDVTVESENADFVAEDMRVDELVEASDTASIKENLLAELRKDSKNSADMKIYDITFFGTDGQEIEPMGKVKVTMTLPKDWDSSKTVRVYHVLDDNTIENMEAEINDEKAVFYTDKFSRYAMVLLDNLKLGDVDFDDSVTMADVTLSLKAALNILKLTDAETAAADVNGDGRVTLEDVTSMLKYSLKIITEFPKASNV